MARVNDDCDSIATWFGTFSAADFISWNLIVGPDCTDIAQDTYYCVGVPGTPTTRSVPLTPTVPPSMPTQTGTASNCTQFWLVSPSDTCASVVTDAAVNATDFYAWNPAVGSDCAGLEVNDYVRVSTTVWDTIPPVSTVTLSNGQTVGVTTSTTSSIASTSSASPSTTSAPATTAPSPYMPGMVDNCVRFYFRNDAAGLYCYGIAADAGIALSDFYAWNSKVGTDCSNLWAETWYCIGIKGVTPTTISTGVPTPA
jgi:hypothetical protein